MSKEGTITEDFKSQTSKFNISKFEDDLYHEHKNTIEKILRIKKVSSEKETLWNFMKDKEIVFTLKSSSLNKEYINYINTIEGISFLLKKYKEGIDSSRKIIKELKNHLKPE
jgi:hypothetical protein